MLSCESRHPSCHLCTQYKVQLGTTRLAWYYFFNYIHSQQSTTEKPWKIICKFLLNSSRSHGRYSSKPLSASWNQHSGKHPKGFQHGNSANGVGRRHSAAPNVHRWDALKRGCRCPKKNRCVRSERTTYVPTLSNQISLLATSWWFDTRKWLDPRISFFVWSHAES